MEFENDSIYNAVYSLYSEKCDGCGETPVISRNAFISSFTRTDSFIDISGIQRSSDNDEEFIENAYALILNSVCPDDTKKSFVSDRSDSFSKRKKLIMRLINSEDFLRSDKKLCFNVFSETGSRAGLKDSLYVMMYKVYKKFPPSAKTFVKKLLRK